MPSGVYHQKLKARLQGERAGLPSLEIVSVLFDPSSAGTLYASVRDAGLFVSRDSGLSWAKKGLGGSVVNRMRFVPAP